MYVRFYINIPGSHEQCQGYAGITPGPGTLEGSFQYRHPDGTTGFNSKQLVDALVQPNQAVLWFRMQWPQFAQPQQPATVTLDVRVTPEAPRGEYELTVIADSDGDQLFHATGVGDPYSQTVIRP